MPYATAGVAKSKENAISREDNLEKHCKAQQQQRGNGNVTWHELNMGMAVCTFAYGTPRRTLLPEAGLEHFPCAHLCGTLGCSQASQERPTV